MLAAIGCGFMAALFPPLMVFALNGDVIRFPLWHLVANGAQAAALVGVGLIALTRLPHVGGGVADVCRVAGIAIFILTIFPNPTGEVTGMGDFLAGAGNVGPLLKIGCLLALLLLLMWKKRTVFDALHDLSLMAAGLIVLAVALGLRVGGGADASITEETRTRAARLGPTNNVIVIVPDAFTGYRMAEVLSADNALRSSFSGFRLFPNAIASAFNTLAGVSTLLTGGLEVARDAAVKRLRIERMMERSWLRESQNLAYEATYFGHLLPLASPVEAIHEQKYFATELLPETSGVNNYRMLLALSMARVMPPFLFHALQRRLAPAPVVAHGRGPEAVRRAYRDATQICERSAYASELAFNYWMDKLHVTPGPPAALFFHSQLTHAPSVFDADGNVGQDHDVVGTMTYATGLLARLCDRLRQLGVYDSTLIIVAADHGYSPPEDTSMGGTLDDGQRLDPVFNPLVMVKPAGGTGPCLMDPMPVWLGDVAATVRDHLGVPEKTSDYPTRSLLQPSDPGRQLRVPLFLHPDQGGFHSSLSKWPHRLVQGGIKAFAEASTTPIPVILKRGSDVTVFAGLDKRRSESIARGWLQGTGAQYRATVDVDAQLAIKRTVSGSVVAMRTRPAAAGFELLDDFEAIRHNIAGIGPGQSLFVGGLALTRAEIAALLPQDTALIPVEGERFNLAFIAGSVITNAPPMISIATNDVSLRGVYER